MQMENKDGRLMAAEREEISRGIAQGETIKTDRGAFGEGSEYGFA